MQPLNPGTLDGRPMRVLHVTQTMSPPYGGPVPACLNECRGLRALGVDTQIYTTSIAYPAGHVDLPTGVPVEMDGVPVWHFRSVFRPYAFAPGFWWHLRRTIRSFDLIHIHGLYRFPMAVATRLAYQNGIPYLCRPHGSLDPYHFFKSERRTMKRLYERLIEMPGLNKASAVHFTAQAELDLAGCAPLTADKVVVPLGIDLDAYERPAANSFRARHGLGNRPLILFMGRLAPQKALDKLSEALGLLVRTHPDVMLLLAGPDHGNYRRQVEDWLAQHGCRDNALFLGMVTGTEKTEMLDAADVFVLASYMENFGISLAEAMAAELPVVISDRVNIWQEVVNAGAGLAVPVEGIRIAEALATYLDSPDRRRSAGQAGRILVAERFEMHAAGRLLLDSYRKILDKHRRSRRGGDLSVGQALS